MIPLQLWNARAPTLFKDSESVREVSGIGGIRGSCGWRPFVVSKCMFGSAEGYGEGALFACVSVSVLPKSGGGGLNGSLTPWVVSSTNRVGRHSTGLPIQARMKLL